MEEQTNPLMPVPEVPTASPMPPPPAAPPAKPARSLRVVWMVLIGIVVLAGAVYGWMRLYPSSPVALESASPSPTADATAGWKTYTNTQYGFEFKYPIELSVREVKPDDGAIQWILVENGLAPGILDLAVAVEERNPDRENYLRNKKPDFTNGKVLIEKISLGNEVKTAYLETWPPIYECYGLGLWLCEDHFTLIDVRPTHNLEITGIIKNEKIPERTNQILSTFKFTR